MQLPPGVTEVLDALRRDTAQALGDNVVGVYLRGSLATGDFTVTSDLDVLTATARPVNDAELAALVLMHEKLDALPGPFASRLEVAYIDRAALRRFAPGQRHPTLYWGEPLRRCEHGVNWILERWCVREHGVGLVGPAPASLIDPISTDEIKDAVRARLADWIRWADQPDPDWPIVYIVETMCRALFTLAWGRIPSKARAVEWALATFAEPWRATVERSQGWRRGVALDRAAMEPEVLALVRWAASVSGGAAGSGVAAPGPPYLF